MKILNLYAGIGGNRKLWGDEHEITAIELDDSVAVFYADQFPNDTVIVEDAHQYLLDHYGEFDFIWSSPPCPSHSRARFWASKPNKKIKPVYPDMKLYQEILLLTHYFSGKFAIENVNPFYTPLIKPTAKIGRHLFWSNFEIAAIPFQTKDITEGKREDWQKATGFSISGYKFNQRTDKILRNCVLPEIGLHILNESQRIGMFQF
jgi:DNA (cytosine-5)-methyltransferase 1